MTIMAINKRVPKLNRPARHRSNDHNSIEVKDIAEYCMVSTSTVRRWLHDGKIKAIILPSHQYRISVVDFQDFLRTYDIPIEKSFF
jgi:excisionase family DNA binding protein